MVPTVEDAHGRHGCEILGAMVVRGRVAGALFVEVDGRPVKLRGRALTLFVWLALVLLAAGVASSQATAEPLGFDSPFRIPAPDLYSIPQFSSNGTEPRLAVGPSGAVFVITSPEAGGSHAVVWRSFDEGRTFGRAPGEIPDQQSASTDVDITTTPSGRLLAVEIDGPVPNFVMGYSDDAGAHWRTSAGVRAVDQDRPWLASGPPAPGGTSPRAYLLWHNLFSAVATQNMFVQTSLDGGAAFGPPVPITQPGQPAWADMQCGTSTGPSSLSVSQTTGRLYAVFSVYTGPFLGGCGRQLTGTPSEFFPPTNKIWVATSLDGAAGTWRLSSAVDDTATGNVAGMVFSPATLDHSGRVYLVYADSPRPYPDLSGESIKLRWAPPDLSRWSTPVTIASGGGPGNLLAHIAVGDSGKVDVAYFHGVTRPGKTPAWYMTVAQTLDALDPNPIVTAARARDIPAYTGTASQLEGACHSGPEPGLINPATCTRASDIWGVALTSNCTLVVAWPAIKNDAPGSDQATFVSRQTSGPTLCGQSATINTPARASRPHRRSTHHRRHRARPRHHAQSRHRARSRRPERQRRHARHHP